MGPFYCGRHSERSVVPGEPKTNYPKWLVPDP